MLKEPTNKDDTLIWEDTDVAFMMDLLQDPQTREEDGPLEAFAWDTGNKEPKDRPSGGKSNERKAKAEGIATKVKASVMGLADIEEGTTMERVRLERAKDLERRVIEATVLQTELLALLCEMDIGCETSRQN